MTRSATWKHILIVAASGVALAIIGLVGRYVVFHSVPGFRDFFFILTWVIAGVLLLIAIIGSITLVRTARR
jgi:uncharacterized membrane protein YbhN (UPF0104 family)